MFGGPTRMFHRDPLWLSTGLGDDMNKSKVACFLAHPVHYMYKESCSFAQGKTGRH